MAKSVFCVFFISNPIKKCAVRAREMTLEKQVYLGVYGMPCVGSERKGRDMRKKRKRERGKHYNLSPWVN